MKHENNKLTDHSYDGIQEYDNQLPKWWLTTFILSLIFAFVYWTMNYIFYSGSVQENEYQKDLSAHQEFVNSKMQDLSQIDFVALANDLQVTAKGKEHFTNYCAACHGANGEGGIGPNMTDNYWIHGYEPKNIISIINNGVSEKGMTAWKGILSPSQINEVTAYILSIEGNSHEKPKEPQGEIVKKES